MKKTYKGVLLTGIAIFAGAFLLAACSSGIPVSASPAYTPEPQPAPEASPAPEPAPPRTATPAPTPLQTATPAPVSATPTPNAESRLEYEYDEELRGIVITGYYDMPANNVDLVIPETIDGEQVVSIGNQAFADCTGIKSVTLPDGLTKIDYAAFRGCTNLTSVAIPDSVTLIDWRAFEGCTGLASIAIPGGVTAIGWNTFVGCTSLARVTISDGVTEIGESAFEGCMGLSNLSMPDSVTLIDDRAFYNCSSLASVTIPAGVTRIGTEAFSGCLALEGITVAPDNPAYTDIDGVPFSKDKTALLLFPCSKGGSYDIPDSVTTIKPEAFANRPSFDSAALERIRDIAGLEAGLVQTYIDVINAYEEAYPEEHTVIGIFRLDYDLIYLDEDDTPELVIGQ